MALNARGDIALGRVGQFGVVSTSSTVNTEPKFLLRIQAVDHLALGIRAHLLGLGGQCSS